MAFYGSRNAAPGTAWRDEDVAMAHEKWGPYEATEDARTALVAAMRREVEWLSTHAASDSAHQRAAIIRAGADKIEAGEDRVETAGLVWTISPYTW